MRQPKSLFNKACQFINSVSVGSTFTSKEYISAIGKHENSTWWKRSNGNTHYNCHQYKGYLRKAGFISHVSHGVWKVDRHIPDWFDFGHLSIVLGYYKWDTANKCNITTYKGLDRSDIIAQLDHDAHHPNGVIPTQDEPGLPKLYSTNREAYEFFIYRVKDMEINSFKTKNELAAFIENIKWPGVHNDGNKPKFAINGNYSPVIDHLLADGWITEKFDGYRYSYVVNWTKPYYRTKEAPTLKMNTQTGKPTVHASIITAAKKTAESSTVKEIQCEPCQAFPFPIEKPTTLESLEALETQMLSMIYQLRELIEIEKSNN
jgi:hypothetical protein